MMKKCKVLKLRNDENLGYLIPGQQIFLSQDEFERLLDAGAVQEILVIETAAMVQPEVR